MPVVNYTISERQALHFTMTATLFEPRTENEADADSITNYDPVYFNIPCYRERRPSQSVVAEFGRIEHDIFGTMDVWHFPPEFVDVTDGWYIKDTTNNSPTKGQIWIVRGEAQAQPKQGERDDGEVFLESAVAQSVPDAVKNG